MPPIFGLIQRSGRIEDGETERVFNMGLGMVFAVAGADVAEARRLAPAAMVVGEVVGAPGVSMEVYSQRRDRMGHVRVALRISNPESPERAVEVPDALVDTGATWTCVPRQVVLDLGLRRRGALAVRTPEGRRLIEQSYASVELKGRTIVTNIEVDDFGSGVRVGSTTLLSLGLAVDPGKGELTETEVLLL